MNSTGNNNHRIGNPKWNSVSGPNRTLFPYPSDNLLYTSFLAGGSLLSMPPSAASIFRSPPNLRHYRQQPPLLRLPISMPPNHQNTNIYRSNSTPNNTIRSSPPRINKNIKNRARTSVTPKKSKNDSKKSVPDLIPKEEKESESSINETIGPDPNDLPKEVGVPRVLTSSIDKFCDFDEFSGSAVFTPSPPPSSLPLPTFSLRSKAGCKAAVAAGVDVGATDGLRRLLKI